MLHCSQDHAQRKLLVAPMDAQPTLASPLRCASTVAFSHGASRLGSTEITPPQKKAPQTCLNLVVVVVVAVVAVVVLVVVVRTGDLTHVCPDTPVKHPILGGHMSL